MISAAPAAADGAGAGNVRFRISGTLNQFPCEVNCTPTTFSGEGDGAGHTVARLPDGDVLDATFTIVNGQVSGSANYDEPANQFCPLIGNASGTSGAGSVTLQGGATGIIRKTSRPTLGGTVYEASTTLDFDYSRVGAAAVIVVKGGSVTVSYTYAGAQGSFTQPMIERHYGALLDGAGAGIAGRLDALDARRDREAENARAEGEDR